VVRIGLSRAAGFRSSCTFQRYNSVCCGAIFGAILIDDWTSVMRFLEDRTVVCDYSLLVNHNHKDKNKYSSHVTDCLYPLQPVILKSLVQGLTQFHHPLCPSNGTSSQLLSNVRPLARSRISQSQAHLDVYQVYHQGWCLCYEYVVQSCKLKPTVLFINWIS
jgi:hypothetical protein